MLKRFLLLGLVALAVSACSEDDDSPQECPPSENPGSAVNFDPAQVPYETLSEYNFFTGSDMAAHSPEEGVVPYDVITPLFADYAHKMRFVWMPDSVHATYQADDALLDFPENTVFLKTFYYDNVQPGNVRQILETRMLFKRNGEWEVAEYIWNDEQTEAHLDFNGKNVPIEWMNEDNELQSVTFRIPAEPECKTCHKTYGNTTPIGPKPQHLNKDYDYADGVKNQLAKWEEVGYLQEGYPLDITSVVPWDDETQDLAERFRSYMDMNCAHCHTEGGHCDYRPIRLAYSENADLVNQGVCVTADEWIGDSYTYIISAGDHQKSIMYVRMEATQEDIRMPLMGRTVKHEEGLELVREYIESLDDPC